MALRPLPEVLPAVYYIGMPRCLTNCCAMSPLVQCSPQCTVDDLAALCSRLPDCGGFNTDGTLKRLTSLLGSPEVTPREELSTDDCAGFYEKTTCSARDNICLTVAPMECSAKHVTWTQQIAIHSV